MRNKKFEDKVNSQVLETQWTDWKWQLKHSIRDIDTFEKLLGIKIESRKEKNLKPLLKNSLFQLHHIIYL
jgi:lysine 2,3-aminomutase